MKTPEAFEQDTAGELDALRRALDASAPVPPLDDLTRERIRGAALDARKVRRRHRLALAASVALLLGGLPLLTLRSPGTLQLAFNDHPLIQDPLLTELDLLDLQLLELTRSFEHNTLYPAMEEFL
ncbi:MAG: hypothetical protein JJU05_09620 [Verrucomicrobia bacterium]|nr:hypothetical protein [Verrucomicrobiota bacterium]MCH8525991.1 hypothetical protein [Kiritimatiellia bacterium]